MCRKDLISQGLLNVCDVNLNLVICVEGTVHVTTDAILNKNPKQHSRIRNSMISLYLCNRGLCLVSAPMP